jgi:hypothetical protein
MSPKIFVRHRYFYFQKVTKSLVLGWNELFVVSLTVSVFISIVLSVYSREKRVIYDALNTNKLIFPTNPKNVLMD